MTKKSRTSVQDVDRVDDRSSINIDRHTPDMDHLTEEVGERIAARLEQNPAGCIYFNPAVTISDPQPRPAFFRLVKKEQARWCKTASESIKNKVRRKVSTWISPAVVNGDLDKYHDRALSYTGILFINGKMIPHHNWPVFVNSKSR